MARVLLQQELQGLASGIASEFTSAFKSVIDGSKSVEEAFADMLKGIANKFLDMAMKLITDALTQQLMKLFGSVLGGGLGGGFGGGIGGGAFSIGMGFANGGRPEENSVSVVGERGPELLLTGSSSSKVISNDDIFGLTRQAMQNEQTNVRSDESTQAETMEQAFGLARQAMSMSTTNRTNNTSKSEQMMIEQLLMNPSDVKVQVDTVNVGGLDVVSQEQLRAATQQAAAKARSDVFKDLKNKPSVRRQAGVS